MSYSKLEKAEPALVVGAITAVVGFAALLGADFSTLHSAAVALGVAGSQMLLTRPLVFSPKSTEEMRAGEYPPSKLAEVFSSGSGLAHPHEPAAAIGVLTLLGGFLVQMFGGVDISAALASAAGIAGVQAAATRARVSSPITARTAAHESVLAVLPEKALAPGSAG